MNQSWIREPNKWDSFSWFVLLTRSMKLLSMKNLEVCMDRLYLGSIPTNIWRTTKLFPYKMLVLRKDTQVTLQVKIKVIKREDLTRYLGHQLRSWFNGEAVSADSLLTQCQWRWVTVRSQIWVTNSWVRFVKTEWAWCSKNGSSKNRRKWQMQALTIQKWCWA